MVIILLATPSISNFCNAQSRKAYLKHSPIGDIPKEIAARVFNLFIATSHLNFGRKTAPRVITYQEVCKWYGTLTFVKASSNKGMEEQIIRCYEPLFTTEASMVSHPDYVDHTVFCTLPFELYMLTKEKKYLRWITFCRWTMRQAVRFASKSAIPGILYRRAYLADTDVDR